MAQKGFIEPGEKPRRFYSEVTVAPGPAGWSVLLDGRAVIDAAQRVRRTPPRNVCLR